MAARGLGVRDESSRARCYSPPVAIEIRTMREDEAPAWLDCAATTFLDRIDLAKVAEEVKPLWDFGRVWGALDGELVVGTLRTWASELTLPGCDRLPASAVSGVSVRATHRRRGILSRVVAAEHAAARERGEAIAMLYASEYPIYGRFGYGPASTAATWTIDTATTGFHRPPSGSVEFATPSIETRDAMKVVFDTWRLRQPAEIRRRDFSWDFDLALRESIWGPAWKGFAALHRDASGTVDGYVRYRGEEKWEHRQPRAIINVDELHALTDDAYDALWQFLASMDLVRTIKAERRSPSERLPWLLTNARAAEPSEVGDGLWVCLLDIPRALAARAYERECAIVIEAVERAGTDGETRTRVALDAGPHGATCAPTDRSPDLTVATAALGAAYLGGTRLRDAVAARGADEHTPGALAKADALFATLDSPWCSTFF
jgi:predicted acetyltransferase